MRAIVTNREASRVHGPMLRDKWRMEVSRVDCKWNLNKLRDVNYSVILLTLHLLTHVSCFENIRPVSVPDVSAG